MTRALPQSKQSPVPIQRDVVAPLSTPATNAIGPNVPAIAQIK